MQLNHLPQSSAQNFRNTYSATIQQICTTVSYAPKNVLEKLDTHSNIGYKLYIQNRLWDKYKTEFTVEDCYTCQKALCEI